MKKILATAAVLAFAGSAFAAPFAVTAAIDFGAGSVAGGQGSPITFEGAPNLSPGIGFPPGPAGIWSGNPAETGVAIAAPDFSSFGVAAFAPGGDNWSVPGQFDGAWFNSAGSAVSSSPISVEGEEFDAIILANFANSVTNINFTLARIGVSGENRFFTGFDQLSDTGGFSLTLVDNGNGGQTMYLISGLIPTPGAAGLLGLAGLAAVRRRR